MYMKNLAERARFLRETLRKKYGGYTQSDVARQMGILQQSYADIESGKSKRPRNIDRLAQVLHTTPEWLQFGVGTPPITFSSEFTIPDGYVPVISWEEVSDKIDLSILKNKDDFIPMFAKGSPNCYALRIKGDSMVSSMPGKDSFIENEIIIVDPDKSPQHGDYVVVLQEGAKEAIFKQYLIEGSNIYLSSLNPRYPTIPFNNQTKICGIVIAKQQYFV
jgi:SOS-response transcriptional repressor LexA